MPISHLSHQLLNGFVFSCTNLSYCFKLSGGQLPRSKPKTSPLYSTSSLYIWLSCSIVEGISLNEWTVSSFCNAIGSEANEWVDIILSVFGYVIMRVYIITYFIVVLIIYGILNMVSVCGEFWCGFNITMKQELNVVQSRWM